MIENKKAGGKRLGAGRKYIGRDQPITLKITKAMKLYHQDNRGWATNQLIKAFDSLPSEIREEYENKGKK